MRTPRRFSTGEDGVSVVIGAILITAIVVIALVSVRLNFVPVWDEDAEAQHMRDVQGQLAFFNGDLHRGVNNQSLASTNYPITLSADRPSIFSPVAAPHTLQFNASLQTLNVASPLVRLLQLNGTVLGAFVEDWTNLPTADELENVTGVQSFRLRIAEVDASHAGDTVTVALFDSSDDFAGDFRVLITNPTGPNFHINFRVRDAAGTIVYDQPEQAFQGGTVSPYWVDLLREDLRFEQVISAADKPMRITLTEAGLDADYAITYNIASETGDQVVTGGGITQTNYTSSLQSGRLVYRAENHQFVDQTYVLEHGALILEQESGNIFRTSPAFSASRVGNGTRIAWSVPFLEGDGSAVSGTGNVILRTTPGRSGAVDALAAQVNFTIPTEYPELWTSHLRATLVNAGLNDTGAQPGFTINTTASGILVSVFGQVPDPANEFFDLFIRYRSGIVNVTLD